MVAPNRSGQLSLNIRRAAQQAVLAKVLYILHLAWPETTLHASITKDSEEDTITDVLRWKMAEAKKQLDPEPDMRFERESQSDRPEKDTPLGLIDIMVIYSWDESAYLTMECKRVCSTDNSLALKYVRNGINRFTSGKYSLGHAFGIMVGYVTCSNSNGCVERIRKTLKKEPQSETGYDYDFGWQTETSTTGRRLHRTRHRQASHENNIELVHSFLELN